MDTPTIVNSTIDVELAAAKAKMAVLEADAQSQLSSLAHKHVTVSYALIGVLVAVLALAGVGGWLGLRFADAQLARAEAAEARYDADRKTFTDALAQNAAQRAQETAQQQVVVKVVDTRDKATDKAITEALKPDATLPAIENGVRMAFKSDPLFQAPLPLSSVYVELSGPQVQDVTATKLDRDRLSADLVDTRIMFTLEQQKNSSLNTDLAGCIATGKESDKVIADYKKAAKAGRFKKFLHGAGVAVAIIAAGYLGHKL